MRIVKTSKTFKLPQKAGKYAVELSYPAGYFPLKREISELSELSAIQLFKLFEAYTALIEENEEVLDFTVTEVAHILVSKLSFPTDLAAIKTFTRNNCAENDILLAIEAVEVYYYISETEKVICTVED